MIKHLKLGIIALAMTAFALNACKKEKAVPEEKTIAFKFKVNQSLLPGTLSSPAITLNSAILNLDNFDVGLLNNGTGVGGNNMSGLWNHNLLTDNSTVWLITFPTYEKYNEIDATLNLKKSNEHPPLTIKAVVTSPSGTQVPVEFYFNDDASLHIFAKSDQMLDRFNTTAVIEWNVYQFLASIDVSKLPSATKTDGKVIISSTSNVNLYNQAKAALNGSYSIALTYDQELIYP